MFRDNRLSSLHEGSRRPSRLLLAKPVSPAVRRLQETVWDDAALDRRFEGIDAAMTHSSAQGRSGVRLKFDLSSMRNFETCKLKTSDSMQQSNTLFVNKLPSARWIILASALIMFMQAGFAMLEAGCCRTGFVSSVLEKNL